MTRQEIKDQCSPAQRKLLDEWAESRWIFDNRRVVFCGGRFYLRLREKKRRHKYESEYGIFAMNWDYVRSEVKKFRREQAKEREEEAQRTIGAYI